MSYNFSLVSLIYDFNFGVIGFMHNVRNSEIFSVNEFTEDTIGLPGISGLCILGRL